MKKRWVALLAVCAMVLSLLTGCGGVVDKAASSGGDSSTAEKVSWKMASEWADGTWMFEIDSTFCDYVSKITNGNFTIKPYGVGQLGAANQVFDLVQQGTVQCGGDWPSYWTGKDVGFDLLATTMFNFTNWDYYVWIYEGGGLDDAYNYMFNQYGMVYFPYVTCGMESGIRTNKPINSLSDLNGMKIRFAGKIQGLVAEKIGISPTSVAADELYEALQRGVVDGAEYSTPYNDDTMKIQEVAKYWLTPGWHQTSSVYGTMINQAAYEALPAEYQEAIEMAARLTFQKCTASYVWKDAQSTAAMLDSGVVTTTLPDEDMALLEQYTNDAIAQLCSESANYQHVWESMVNYRKTIAPYREALGEFGFGMNLSEYPAIG